MLSDPTAGVGYAFGEVLPSAEMTTIATNQPKAIDGAGGGAWTPAADIELTGPNCIKLMGTTNIKLQTRSLTMTHPLLCSGSVVEANWLWAIDSWQNVTAEGSRDFELFGLPHGQLLTAVTAQVAGAPLHAAWPADKPILPYFELRTYNLSGVMAVIHTEVDPSATVLAYESVHAIPATGLGATIDRAYRYVLRFYSEATDGGAGAWNTGGLLYGISTTVSCSNYVER